MNNYQEIITDSDGIKRFKENPVVKYLFEQFANELPIEQFEDDDLVQFAQLIGMPIEQFKTQDYVYSQILPDELNQALEGNTVNDDLEVFPELLKLLILPRLLQKHGLELDFVPDGISENPRVTLSLNGELLICECFSLEMSRNRVMKITNAGAKVINISTGHSQLKKWGMELSEPVTDPITKEFGDISNFKYRLGFDSILVFQQDAKSQLMLGCMKDKQVFEINGVKMCVEWPIEENEDNILVAHQNLHNLLLQQLSIID